MASLLLARSLAISGLTRDHCGAEHVVSWLVEFRNKMRGWSSCAYIRGIQGSKFGLARLFSPPYMASYDSTDTSIVRRYHTYLTHVLSCLSHTLHPLIDSTERLLICCWSCACSLLSDVSKPAKSLGKSDEPNHFYRILCTCCIARLRVVAYHRYRWWW
jgi:hypothetical protein